MTPGEFLLRQANGEDPRKLLWEYAADVKAEVFKQLHPDVYDENGDLLEGVGE